MFPEKCARPNSNHFGDGLAISDDERAIASAGRAQVIHLQQVELERVQVRHRYGHVTHSNTTSDTSAFAAIQAIARDCYVNRQDRKLFAIKSDCVTETLKIDDVEAQASAATSTYEQSDP